MKRLIVDLDDTICKTFQGHYSEATPNHEMIEKLRQYQNNGFEIVISTSRNMKTYNENIGKINANTLPIIIDWLKKFNVPYDEIYIAKPWCGTEGFYIDDRSIRPAEFLKFTYEDVISKIEKEKCL